MALKSTIFKISLNIADMDRHYYADHNLTIARHPSENDLRMMVRVAVFALNASEQLSFTKGISTDDEPDIWDKSLSDEIELWIDLGQPDEKRIRQACGKSRKVRIYTYQNKAADIWFEQVQSKLTRFDNLEVFRLDSEEVEKLPELVERHMQLSAIIQDGELTLSNEGQQITIKPTATYSAT